MKRSVFFFLLMLPLLTPEVYAQDAAHDSVDVLHYRLTLDLGHTRVRQLRGVAEITFVKTQNCSQVAFDLIADSVHPVSIDGTVTRGFSYNPDDRLLQVYVGGQVGDTHVLSVPYVTNGYVESYGFGGMHMDYSIYYNLGVAFKEYPHSFGRCLFPCRDNFYDKATYTFVVTSQPGWRSMCSGLLQSSFRNSDGSLTEEWQLNQPIPTYLASVSSAQWHVIETSFAGEHQSYPALLGFIDQDSIDVVAHFDMINQVVPMFERCFGPYRWERIGYISTPRGSMEHAQNIALAYDCMSMLDNSPCNMTTCHELAHAWFGNLITCATAGDMWINEGGASFCEEVAAEAIYGSDWAESYYLSNLRTVLRTAHVKDGNYFSLSDMPERNTYGSTTYDKGALVWHSLRGVMGDSLFYASMRRLFSSCAFGNIDAATLRDSLSLYSGIDLTGFFDFHVSHPGFVDYSVDRFDVQGNNATLTLRQLLRGATRYARGNRVPVTFFSHDLQQSDQWMIFDDSVATCTFKLPFAAAFAIVDYHNAISDACTGGSVSLKKKEVVNLPVAYCKLSVSKPLEENSNWVYVGHHFARPTGDTLPGIVRLANRYWEVNAQYWDENTTLRLFYNQGSYDAEGASFLDENFYEKANTLDSIAVVYRPDASHPWQVVSHKRTASSSASSGYFVAPFFPYGQYALAVVDTALLDIRAVPTLADGSQTPQLQVSPNPNRTEFQIEMGGYDKKFDLSVFDIKGNKVLEKRDLSDRCTVRHNLPAGSYIVLIKNNCVSLQSQIIVQ